VNETEIEKEEERKDYRQSFKTTTATTTGSLMATRIWTIAVTTMTHTNVTIRGLLASALLLPVQTMATTAAGDPTSLHTVLKAA